MDWHKATDIIHRAVIKKWPAYGDEDRHFLALALGGEVGELQNLVKKEWRGSFAVHDREFLAKIGEEMADIRIYLDLLARGFGVDLDRACEEKIPELLKRWPEAKVRIEEASR